MSGEEPIKILERELTNYYGRLKLVRNKLGITSSTLVVESLSRLVLNTLFTLYVLYCVCARVCVCNIIQYWCTWECHNIITCVYYTKLMNVQHVQ